MPQTPDRFPGVREDEGIILDETESEPTQEGEIRYVNGKFIHRDMNGVTNSRSAYHAESNPTVDDDEDAGFSIGMLWINVSTAITYILRDSTPGSAVWTNLSAGFDVDSILVDDEALEVLVDDGSKNILVNL